MPSDPIDLRPARPDEAIAIAALVRAAYAKWVPVIGREPRPMSADYDKALREHQFDLAVGNSRILGLIETIQRDDHLWIENVAVHPEAQGRGIGRRLLSLAERKAMDANTPEVRLLTNAAFAANLTLYLRLGYVVDREEAFMNGMTVYLSKRLAR